MTLPVRDEADIVDCNLAYHLARGVDAVIVTDHRSQDGTRERLEAWAGTSPSACTCCARTARRSSRRPG